MRFDFWVDHFSRLVVGPVMGYHTRVVTATHIYYDIYHRDWVHPKCQWILGSGLLIIEVNVNQSWINFTKPLPTTAIVIVHRLCLTFSACIVIYVKGLLQHCRSMKYMICSKCPANDHWFCAEHGTAQVSIFPKFAWGTQWGSSGRLGRDAFILWHSHK